MGANLERARVLLELRRHHEAEELLRAHLAADPDSAEALGLLAFTLQSTGRPAEAVVAARRAVAAAPADVENHIELAYALKETGEPDAAEEVGRHLLGLAPDDARAHQTLAWVLCSSPRHRTRKEALRHAKSAVALAPTSAGTHVMLGLCQEALDDGWRARSAYRKALSLDPMNSAALANLASHQARRGRLRNASELTTSGLQEDAQHTALHATVTGVLAHLALLVGTAAIAISIAFSRIQEGQGPEYLRPLLFLAALSALGLWSRQVVHRLPRGARRLLWPAIRQLPWLAQLYLVFTAGLWVVVGVSSFLPAGTAQPVVERMLGIAFTGLMLALVWGGWLVITSRFPPGIASRRHGKGNQ